MNDQMMNEGLIPWRMLQLTTWLELMQPLLYCLLAVALLCLLLALIDLMLLCWKEFHPTLPPPATSFMATSSGFQQRQPVGR